MKTILTLPKLYVMLFAFFAVSTFLSIFNLIFFNVWDGMLFVSLAICAIFVIFIARYISPKIENPDNPLNSKSNQLILGTFAAMVVFTPLFLAFVS